MTEAECDVLLVGGGLANSLIALELRRRRPDLRLLMLDPSAEAEEHTWCVFETDMGPGAWDDLHPVMSHSWDGYSVSFPAHGRALATRYGCLTSTGLREAVVRALGPRLVAARAVAVATDGAAREDGVSYGARLVIDGRGARASEHLELGFQKFVGLEVALRRPHGLDRPIVMDATVRQEDGFRFVYVLPTGPQRLLIEDTRYSDGSGLDRLGLESEVLRYARGHGWAVTEVVRRESGVLPVVLDGDIETYWREPGREVPQVGMRGAFFHPTTGYSFPDAIQVAALVAEHADDHSAAMASRLRERSVALWKDRGFYRLLNRMLFKAAHPAERYRVLERFYRLPQPIIERFYAGRTTLGDKVRILSGRPPVPVWRAIRAAAAPRDALAHA